MKGKTAPLRFSLASVPERDRAETLQEVFGNGFANVNFVPLTPSPQLEVEARMLPGITITRGFYTPHSMTFNQDTARASDDFTLVAGRGEKRGLAKHRGLELESGDGSAFLISCSEPTLAKTQSLFAPCSVTISRSILLPYLPKAEDALMRLISADNPALRLLNSYLLSFQDYEIDPASALAHAIGNHIRDLVVLAVGSTSEAEAEAASGGLRAARLAAVKQWALARLSDGELSVAQAAAAQGVTPRYVQLLFESDDTTFSSFLLASRLALSHSHLSNPAHAGKPISVIAYSAGFNDLSYFNRTFRSAYHQSPSDVRHQATRTGSK